MNATLFLPTQRSKRPSLFLPTQRNKRKSIAVTAVSVSLGPLSLHPLARLQAPVREPAIGPRKSQDTILMCHPSLFVDLCTTEIPTCMFQRYYAEHATTCTTIYNISHTPYEGPTTYTTTPQISII